MRGWRVAGPHVHGVEAIAGATGEVVRVVPAILAVGRAAVVERVAVTPVAVIDRAIGVVVVAVDVAHLHAGIRAAVMVEIALASRESDRGRHDDGETHVVLHNRSSLQPSYAVSWPRLALGTREGVDGCG